MWFLRANEIAILQRTEKEMIRAMHGVKLIEKSSSQELENWVSLEETLDRLAKANGMQLYGHVLRRNNNNNVFRRALNFEVFCRRGCGRLEIT